MTGRMGLTARLLAISVWLASTGVSALAHPHVWVVMKVEITYGAAGFVTGIHHVWTFDAFYSALVIEGLTGKKKVLTREELAPTARENMKS